MEECSSARAAAISRASPAGFLKMVSASRVAVLAPMPGSDEKLLTSRSRAGGITCISAIAELKHVCETGDLNSTGEPLHL